MYRIIYSIILKKVVYDVGRHFKEIQKVEVEINKINIYISMFFYCKSPTYREIASGYSCALAYEERASVLR